MDNQHTSFNNGQPISNYCHRHKQSLSVSLLGCFLLAGLNFHVLAQTVEPKSRERIIFEPRLITVTPSDAHQNFEEYREAIDINPVLDEAGIISTPERAVYVNQLERHEDLANQLVIEEGVYSKGLIDSYLAMADIYEKNEQLDLAFEAYDSALQVIRIEHGLDSEMQLPVMKALADIHMKKGNIATARDELEKIKFIQSEFDNNNPAGSIMLSLDYATNLYDLAAHAYYHNSTDHGTIIASLLDAKQLFNNTAVMLSQGIQNNSATLSNLYTQIVKTNYFIETIVTENEIHGVTNNGMYYLVNNTSKEFMDDENRFLPSYNSTLSNVPLKIATLSKKTEFDEADQEEDDKVLPPYIESIILLNSILNEKVSDSENTESVFVSRINAADWSLMVGHYYKKNAKQFYDEAFLFLQESELENKEELIDEYFNQEIPTQIPAFLPAEYSLEGYDALDSAPRTTLGFVDVTFRLDRNGHAKRVKTQYRSPELGKEYEDMLVEDIKSNQYRPAFEGSKPVRKNYSLRYYVSVLN